MPLPRVIILGEVNNMDTNFALEEDVIGAWVRLTGLLKNTRLTDGLQYNEAIIMNIVYRKYREDGKGLVSFKNIVTETSMLKSLVNRTIDSLVKRGLLERISGTSDRRTTFIRPVEENLQEYLDVHERTLDMVHQIIEIIGKDDAEAFVRLSNKLAKVLLS